jgi:hypothetical protein
VHFASAAGLQISIVFVMVTRRAQRGPAFGGMLRRPSEKNVASQDGSTRAVLGAFAMRSSAQSVDFAHALSPAATARRARAFPRHGSLRALSPPPLTARAFRRHSKRAFALSLAARAFRRHRSLHARFAAAARSAHLPLSLKARFPHCSSLQ